jgi:hypothetical protein
MQLVLKRPLLSLPLVSSTPLGQRGNPRPLLLCDALVAQFLARENERLTADGLRLPSISALAMSRQSSTASTADPAGDALEAARSLTSKYLLNDTPTQYDAEDVALIEMAQSLAMIAAAPPTEAAQYALTPSQAALRAVSARLPEVVRSGRDGQLTLRADHLSPMQLLQVRAVPRAQWAALQRSGPDGPPRTLGPGRRA